MIRGTGDWPGMFILQGRLVSCTLGNTPPGEMDIVPLCVGFFKIPVPVHCAYFNSRIVPMLQPRKQPAPFTPLQMKFDINIID